MKLFLIVYAFVSGQWVASLQNVFIALFFQHFNKSLPLFKLACHVLNFVWSRTRLNFLLVLL